MKRLFPLILIVISLGFAAGCGTTLNKDWIIQDRDNFGELDDAGLDRWIESDPTLSPERKEALRLLNFSRRARVQRGLEAIGETITAVPLTVSGTGAAK